MKASKGDWIEIESIILREGERAENIPEDTRSVPLNCYIQGFLEEDTASLNDEVTIRTMINRIHVGKLSDLSPSYKHDFGKPVPELLPIGTELMMALKEEVRRL